ncbi:MAG TPA: polysaccharide biosynthesis/export family protein [Polyangiaceae bacterium]|nr:polysaccharide biosynthesis/export family protein [Polyangiaceae bacterium]
MASRLSGYRIAGIGGRWCIAVALLLGSGASACSGSQPYVWVAQMPLDRFRGAPEDRIGVDDLISIRVYAQEPMSARGHVRPDGTLSMPLLGEVPVAGKRPSELGRELEEQLKQRGLVVAPSVTVSIEETAPIRITFVGEVRRPGTLKLEGPINVVQGIANAGGLTEFASGSRIFVVRTGPPNNEVQRIRFRYEDLVAGEPHATAFRLRTGDVVVVE